MYKNNVPVGVRVNCKYLCPGMNTQWRRRGRRRQREEGGGEREREREETYTCRHADFISYYQFHSGTETIYILLK